jgi:hypothetical protein
MQGKLLSQGKVTGSDVSVQFVFALAIFLERPEKASVRLAKRFGFEATGAYGSLHAGVVFGIAKTDD